MYKFLGILLLLLTVLSGCERSITKPEPKSFKPFFSLNERNYWVVNTVYNNSVDTLRYISSHKVGADGQAGWSKVTWSSNEGINNMLAKQTEEGLVYCWDKSTEKPYSLLGMKTKHKILSSKYKHFTGGDNFASYLIAKYPIAYEEEWVLMYNVLEDNQGQPGTFYDIMKCNSKDLKITTPAGVFNCIVYRENYEFVGDFDSNIDNGFVRYYYYAENVGLVKILYKDNGSEDFLIEYELVDYNID